MCRRAFDLGITHFDLANNYGPPPGSAESLFGQILKDDFRGLRDELVISTKAGYGMWPGPYGEWGQPQVPDRQPRPEPHAHGARLRRHLLLAPLRPRHAAGGDHGRSRRGRAPGKALYVGISSYSSQRTHEAAEILRRLGTPAIIHQPSYSILNRWTEEDQLLDALESEGMGCISFSPLAQGLLTDKYLKGVPEDSRAGKGSDSWQQGFLSEKNMTCVRALNELAGKRGQTLAQMAIAWVLRDPRMTSALIGASRVEQIEDAVGALATLEFSDKELDEIDARTTDAGINLWKRSSTA